MTSFIVVSSDKKLREDYIAELCTKAEIDKFDITLIEKESSKNQNSIGLEEIKTLREKIYLKPIRSSVKAIILEDAHLLTVEAQNALLKVLEEPPENTIIIISANSKENILPTIISRCQITALSAQPVAVADDELPEFLDFADRIRQMKIGERLKKAEELSKDKDKALLWISKLILVLRNKLIEDYSDKFLHASIKELQKLYTELQTTNVGARIAIENTMLSI